MPNIPRGGFHPVDATKWKPRRYEVASGYGTALFPGDVCRLVTAGVVEAAAAGNADLLGVIAWVSYVDGSGKRVYGGYVPASTTYSPTARGSRNATYVGVWDQPSIEYLAQVASAAGAATAYAGVGANMDITATAGDTVYKRSNHELDGTFVAATAQFRILEILRSPAQDLASTRYLVKCMINEGFHAFFSAAGV